MNRRWVREHSLLFDCRLEVNEMSGHTLRVLIVDDEEMVAKMLKSFFELRGAFARVAYRGEEALQLLKNENFHAAIVDMRLPDTTGDELIMKAATFSPDVHYFIHTGSMDYRLSNKLRELGMKESDILQKPVRDMNEIYQAIIARVATEK